MKMTHGRFGVGGDVFGDAPTISSWAVPFRDLDAVLPKGIARIDAAGRREQIARREAGFNRRVIDH